MPQAPRRVPLRKNQAPLPGKKPTPQSYEPWSDAIGGVPNLRKRDNLYQLLCTVIMTLLGLAIGFLAWGSEGILPGLFIGVIVGGIGSGGFLMIRGWIRAWNVRKNKSL